MTKYQRLTTFQLTDFYMAFRSALFIKWIYLIADKVGFNKTKYDIRNTNDAKTGRFGTKPQPNSAAPFYPPIPSKESIYNTPIFPRNLRNQRLKNLCSFLR
jgi:hypothetical protein